MPEWRLRRQFRFEASHLLPDHDGKCRRMHGHGYALGVEVSGCALRDSGPKRGMLMDYGDLKEIVGPIVDGLDHRHLNDFFPNPTSEAIAEAVALQIADKLPPGIRLVAVTIGETCTTECEYRP